MTVFYPFITVSLWKIFLCIGNLLFQFFIEIYSSLILRNINSRAVMSSWTSKLFSSKIYFLSVFVRNNLSILTFYLFNSFCFAYHIYKHTHTHKLCTQSDPCSLFIMHWIIMHCFSSAYIFSAGIYRLVTYSR